MEKAVFFCARQTLPLLSVTCTRAAAACLLTSVLPPFCAAATACFAAACIYRAVSGGPCDRCWSTSHSGPVMTFRLSYRVEGVRTRFVCRIVVAQRRGLSLSSLELNKQAVETCVDTVGGMQVESN